MLADAIQHHRSGRRSEAEAAYRRILTIDPRHADGLHLLGVLAHQAGHCDQAIDLIRRAIAVEGGRAEFHHNLGNAFAASNRLDEAASCFRDVTALQPDHAAAHSNLGSVLTMLGRPDEGIGCLRRAIRIRPDRADSHYNLGNALARQWHLGEAIQVLRHAIAIRPDADAYNTLGNALRDSGNAEASVAAYEGALRIRPDDFALRSNRLLVENYLADRAPGIMRELATAFGALARSRVARPFSEWHAGPGGGPVRVGLVSNDLHNHPVGYFLENLLIQADPARVAFVAFPDHDHEDALTARIKPRFHAWKPIAGMSDEAAARLIHAQRIHVLIDLSGHTAGNRLPLFAWRPAPVQATWLGYFATTGMSEIDYIVADPNVLPPGLSAPLVEKPWRLPEIYYCFTPPSEAIEVSALPARASGLVTFGCFNNLAKINDAVIAVWARLLDAVPESRLMLKAAPLQDATVGAALRSRFAAHGIPGERLLLEGASSRGDYLRTYHRIDIALDPFPFPGGATTCEALWMGVPVLTRKGDRFLSRVGETILRNAGLPDWLADDGDDYVSKAVGLVADLDRLARLRETLRSRVLDSPLFDSSHFARHFEAAMTGMWANPGTGTSP